MNKTFQNFGESTQKGLFLCMGLDLQTLQSEGKLKAVEIPEGEKEK